LRFSIIGFDSLVSSTILFVVQMNKRQFHCLSSGFLFVNSSFIARRVSLKGSVLRGILTHVLFHLDQIQSDILGLVGSDVLCCIQRLVRSCVCRGSMIGSSVFGRGHIFGFEHKSGSISFLANLGFYCGVGGMVSSFLNRLGFNLNFLRFFSFLFQMNIFFVLEV